MSIQSQLVQTAQRAYREKMFAATSGNLSVFDRESGKIYITPGSFPYEKMTPEDIMAIDLDGNILEGKHSPSSEWRMHAAIYRADKCVNAIVHTHSPYATAFAVVHRPIPPVLIETQIFLNGGVECAEYATPGTFAVGENAVPCLKDGRGGCLLNNHGALAVGKDLNEARTRAQYIEDSARIYHYALQIGEPVVLAKL